MKIRLIYILLLFLVIALLHFAALYSGFYDLQIQMGFVWWDNVLHVLVGIAFGLLWLWLLQSLNYDTSSRFAMLSMFLFVLFLALGWEGAEYLARLYVRSLAESLQIFSPNLTEASSDILSDLLGGILLSTYLKLFNGPSSSSF